MISEKILPTIAILGGTGNEGPGLALRWAKLGYPVIIGSRKTEKAQATALELNNILKIDSIQGLENSAAASRADICVLTVVSTAHQTALEGLREVLKGKILIDATARVDFRDNKPPPPPSAARIAQDLLGDEVQVVAAFQNVPAAKLRKNIDQPLDGDVLICSDNLAAAEEVIKLAEALGMGAYFAGGLDNAIVLEGLTAVLIDLNKHYGSRMASIRISGIASQDNLNQTRAGQLS